MSLVDNTGPNINNPLPNNQVGQPVLINKELTEIKMFINQHKEQIKYSEVAIQTIEAIGQLELAVQQLKKQSLQNDVYKMTGLAIHAADNYQTVEQFSETVKNASKVINNIFKEANNDKDKLQFINRGLDSPGCFEARIEHLMDFDRNRHSALSLMKYEALEFLADKGRTATLPEFVALLDDGDFFKLHKIEKENFKNSEAVTILRSLKLIEPEEVTMIDRIHAALAVYPDFGSGLENCKHYLQQELSLTPEQFSKLDQDLDEYFKKFPDSRKWI